MTPQNKKIANGLLQGFFLKKTLNITGRAVYKLYDGSRPAMYIHKLDKTISDCLKEDRHKRMSLNLTMVRQLNGNSFLKRQYRAIKQIKKSIP